MSASLIKQIWGNRFRYHVLTGEPLTHRQAKDYQKAESRISEELMDVLRGIRPEEWAIDYIMGFYWAKDPRKLINKIIYLTPYLMIAIIETFEQWVETERPDILELWGAYNRVVKIYETIRKRVINDIIRRTYLHIAPQLEREFRRAIQKSGIEQRLALFLYDYAQELIEEARRTISWYRPIYGRIIQWIFANLEYVERLWMLARYPRLFYRLLARELGVSLRIIENVFTILRRLKVWRR